jgi:hypothetical protein
LEPIAINVDVKRKQRRAVGIAKSLVGARDCVRAEIDAGARGERRIPDSRNPGRNGLIGLQGVEYKLQLPDVGALHERGAPFGHVRNGRALYLSVRIEFERLRERTIVRRDAGKLDHVHSW